MRKKQQTPPRHTVGYIGVFDQKERVIKWPCRQGHSISGSWLPGAVDAGEMFSLSLSLSLTPPSPALLFSLSLSLSRCLSLSVQSLTDKGDLEGERLDGPGCLGLDRSCSFELRCHANMAQT